MLKKNTPQKRGVKDIHDMTLRALRLYRNYPVIEVADRIAVPCARIIQWEDGVSIPSADDAIKLSAFYGCSLQGIYSAIINTPRYR